MANWIHEWFDDMPKQPSLKEENERLTYQNERLKERNKLLLKQRDELTEELEKRLR